MAAEVFRLLFLPRRSRRGLHLHLISDSTGETLITVARAAAAQYSHVVPLEHVHPLVRTQKQLDRVLKEIEEMPRGIMPGATVEIESLAQDGKRRIVQGFRVKPYNIPAGCIGAYYPETNPLLPLAHHDVKSGTPAAKSIPVLVRVQAPETLA